MRGLNVKLSRVSEGEPINRERARTLRVTVSGNGMRLGGTMEMETKTTKRELLAAVCALGANEGTVEQRIRTAYERHLSRLSAAHFPGHLRRDYEQLMFDLALLLNQGSEVEGKPASSLAKRIVALYDRVLKNTTDDKR